MRKISSYLLAVAVGAALAYLFDPDRGKSRRSRMSDQAAARARDVAEEAKAQAEYQKGVAKGVFHEVKKSLQPEGEFDDETLLQKIRSEALGYIDSSGIEVDVTDGNVRVTGSIDDEKSRDRLLKLVRAVDGVGKVESQISLTRN
jgi:osmotically-inducible protein OsmY